MIWQTNTEKVDYQARLAEVQKRAFCAYLSVTKHDTHSAVPPLSFLSTFRNSVRIMEKVSVVIPLIPQHDSELLRIFKEISNESEIISEVIICRSETIGIFSNYTLRRYIKWAHAAGLTSKIILSSIKDSAPDGVNRNRGWEIATGNYVVFLDADDSYARNRISSVISTMKHNNYDLFLHNYALEEESLAEVLRKDTALQAVSLKVSDSHLSKDGLDPITDSSGNVLQIHHAHISIRNSSIVRKLKFTNRFPGADTEFCKRAVSSELNCGYSSLKLSKWSRDRSLRYKVRLLRKKLKTFLSSK